MEGPKAEGSSRSGTLPKSASGYEFRLFVKTGDDLYDDLKEHLFPVAYAYPEQFAVIDIRVGNGVIYAAFVEDVPIYRRFRDFVKQYKTIEPLISTRHAVRNVPPFVEVVYPEDAFSSEESAFHFASDIKGSMKKLEYLNIIFGQFLFALEETPKVGYPVYHDEEDNIHVCLNTTKALEFLRNFVETRGRRGDEWALEVPITENVIIAYRPEAYGDDVPMLDYLKQNFRSLSFDGHIRWQCPTGFFHWGMRNRFKSCKLPKPED